MGAEGSELDVPSHVLEFLREHMTLTLATASRAAVPRAATLLYASDGPVLYVWTRPDTITAKHVHENPSVSFAIDQYTADWRETRGVQGNGECRPLEDEADIGRAVALFAEKFPSLSDPAAPAGIMFFRIVPAELEFIDRAASPGDAGQGLGFEYNREVVYSVFRDLPEADVATLAADLETTTFDAGEVVVRQGDTADRFFIVVDGELEVVREGDAGEQLLRTLERGQFFGEIAILRESPRTATVRARTPATLLAMDRNVFRSVMAQSLGTREDFDRVILERLARSDAADGS